MRCRIPRIRNHRHDLIPIIPFPKRDCLIVTIDERSIIRQVPSIDTSTRRVVADLVYRSNPMAMQGTGLVWSMIRILTG
jgi:hypothetical protein